MVRDKTWLIICALIHHRRVGGALSLDSVQSSSPTKNFSRWTQQQRNTLKHHMNSKINHHKTDIYDILLFICALLLT